MPNAHGPVLPARSVQPLAILVLAAGVASPAAAQDAQPVCRDGEARLVGVVVDAVTEAPLASASVSVARSDWQSLTTDGGRFLLCEIGAGPHLLTAERLGYKTVTAPVVATASGDPLRVRMQADPIVLEGLEVVMDRFNHRRRAVATTVQTYNEEELAGGGHLSVADFIDSRPGIMAAPCRFRTCVYVRGGTVESDIYLDEMPLMGGWAELESIPTAQLYMVEVYGRGRHIRAYSHAFMERAAKIRLMPMPIWQ